MQVFLMLLPVILNLNIDFKNIIYCIINYKLCETIYTLCGYLNTLALELAVIENKVSRLKVSI